MQRLTTLLLVVLLFPHFASASKSSARSAFRDGVQQYSLGNFSRALESFKQGYIEYDEPAFLFNIAQCQRQLGDRTEAVSFYRAFLARVPRAGNRKDIERMIHQLEHQDDATAP